MNFEFTERHFWITLILIAAVMGVIQGICAYLTFLERKISAWIQDRIGPNRAGREFGVPLGLLQPIADGLKFLFKEQVIPGNVDKLFYLAAPMVAVGTALFAFAVVPFGRTTTPPSLLDRRTGEMVKASAEPLDQEAREKLLTDNTAFLGKGTDNPGENRGIIWPRTETEKAYALAADRAYVNWLKQLAADSGPPTNPRTYEQAMQDYNETTQFVIVPHVDVGLVFVFAIGSLAVYAIVLGGWSSNNKYSFMGALRSSAQLISYEIPLGMAVLGVFLMAGSLNLEKIVEQQVRDGWNVFFQPLACLLFITSLFAECNRVPFDLPEAEQELVGGYHTEYSGMKFALFFLGEYTHMITTSMVMVLVFFGGWNIPFVPRLGNVWADSALCLVIIAVKMAAFIAFYMFIRWTIPRFRFDQLMALAWKVMMPLALINLVALLILRHYHPLGQYSHWLMLPLSLVIFVGAAVVSLRMPAVPQKAKVIVRGHPVTGNNQVIVG